MATTPDPTTHPTTEPASAPAPASGGSGPAGAPRPFEVLSPAQLRRRTSVKWQHFGPDVIPVWVAEMDVLLAPEVVEALTDAVRRGDTGYPGSGTTYADAFAQFADRMWAWAPRAGDTLMCADVMTGIRILLDRIVPAGGTVVVPTPVYPPFTAVVRELGRQVVAVELTAEGRLDLPAIADALARTSAAALLLCSPQNPTGVVHTPAELAAVAESAARVGATVVVDEVHAPLVPEGATFVPWLAVSDSGFVVTSAAKTFNLAGLKAGLIVAGPRSRDVLRGLPESVRYGASHLGVIGHAAGWRAAPAWLRAVNANIAENRALLAALLAERMPAPRYRVPQATYLAWLDFRALGLGDDPAAVLLERGRVALTSGVPFGPGAAGFARVNLACSAAVLTEAVARMATGARQPDSG